MLTTFSTEIKKIGASRKSILALLVFLVLALFLVNSDFDEYYKILADKEKFSQYEKLNTSQYPSYEIYGAYGFQLFYLPSPLNIFFSKGPTTTKSHINLKESVDMNSSRKGSYAFTGSGYFNSFSEFFLFFGSLIILLYAANTFKNKKSISFYKRPVYLLQRIICRLVLSWLYFGLVFIFSLLLTIMKGLDFSGSEIKIFFIFMFFTLLTLTSFFFTGVVISLLTALNKKNVKYEAAILSWIILTVLAPLIIDKIMSNKFEQIQSNEKLNISKLKRAMKHEKNLNEEILALKENDNYKNRLDIVRKRLSEYLKEGHKKNIELENMLSDETDEAIHFYEKISLLFPTTYYCFLNNEISNKSCRSHWLFFQYIMKMRDGFMDFYIQKRYYSKDKKVESFIKAKENIFTAKSRLPDSFFTAVGLHLLYLIILSAVSFFLLLRLRRPPGKGKKIKEILLRGAAYTKFFESDAKRDAAFNDYSVNPNTVGLDRIDKYSLPDVDGLKIKDVIRWFSRIREVEKKQAYRCLSCLEAPENTRLDSREDLEIIKKIYAAVILSARADIVVINDFLKNEPRKFEELFKKLMQEIISQNRTLIYLCSEVPAAEKRKNIYEITEESGFAKVEIDLLSFR